MSKKKREHIVFDLTRKPKKSIPFASINKSTGKTGQVSLKNGAKLKTEVT